MLLASAAAAALRRSLVPESAAVRLFSRSGFHLLRKSYYLPIPQDDDLAPSFWNAESALVGVDLNEAAALALLDGPLARYAAEFRATFPTEGVSVPGRFHVVNGSFMAVDAHAYYALVRHFKPGRVLEIGAGFSTLVVAAAALRNERETGRAANVTAIEPYPHDWLRNGVAGLTNLVERKVQQVPLEEFAALDAGDVLFIDSSHVLRSGGDVEFEFLEILPRLRPGVLVHVHDISLPGPYPRTYHEQRLFWNEQQLLQSFLAFNRRFEVIWPGAYIAARHPKRVLELFPEVEVMRRTYPLATPTSFWMRVRPEA